MLHGNLISDYLTYAIAAVTLLLAMALLSTSRRSRDMKEWLIGIAAGLDFAQIAHVHLFTIAVVLWLTTDRDRPLRKTSPLTIALLLAAAALGATAFVGPLALDHTLSLQLMALALSAAIVAAKASPDAVRRMAEGLLAVCLLSACWAILQKAGLLPIHRFNAVEGTSRPMGIYREPDWLGLFSAVGIVTTLRLRLSTSHKIAFLSLLSLALVFSLARASVVALAVIGAIAVVSDWLTQTRAAGRSRNRQALLALSGVVVVVLGLTPSVSDRLVTRFQTGFANSREDVGARSRALQVQSLDLLARRAPWYGDGFSASGRVQVTGSIAYGAVSQRAVSTDWVLGWWVDGKYLALPLILTFCLLCVRNARRLGGQLLIVVLVTSLVTDAVLLPIAWFAVGLCLASDAIAERSEPSGAAGGRGFTPQPASA